MLRKPEWQSLQLLPESYVYRLEQVADWMEENIETPDKMFHGFKDYEIQRIRRDIDWMRKGQELDPAYVKQQKANFYRFFNEHDRRRNTNFLKTFPEMRAWWEECRYWSNQ